MAQRKALTQQGEITGIFIVHNATKDLYYVGQSAKAIDRAAIQFLGRGNCDVYADYKYGDSFNVRIVRFQKAATKVSMSSNAQRYKRSRLLARSFIKGDC